MINFLRTIRNDFSILINKYIILYNKFLIYKPKLFSGFILKQYIKEFFYWLFAVFIVLFSISYIENISLVMNFFCKFASIFIDTCDILLSIIDVVILCSCISFFIRIKGYFNIFILQSFGITTMQILKPIILFVVFLCFFNTFITRPIVLNNFNKMLNIK